MVRAFIDTSAMLKKYLDETGSDAFNEKLSSITEIVVSPTYILESHSAIQRRVRQKELSVQQAHELKKEINKDIVYFEQVSINPRFYEIALHLISIHPLTALDSIQLASASVSNADFMITADKQLFKYAARELKKVQLV